MKPSDDRQMLLCWRKVDQPVAHPEADAYTEWCSRCRAEVWIAHSSREFMKREPLTIVCFPCGMSMMDATSEEIEICEIPGQRAEVRAALQRLRRERDTGGGGSVSGL